MIRPIYNALETVSGLLARVSEIAVITMTGVMVVSLFLQIVSRYFFNSTIIWTEELALLMFTWVVLIGGSLGVRQRFHARLTFFLDGGGKYVKVALERLTDFLVVLFSIFLLNSGIGYLNGTRGSYSAAAEYPLELLYLSVPLAGFFMLVYSITALIAPISYRDAVNKEATDNA